MSRSCPIRSWSYSFTFYGLTDRHDPRLLLLELRKRSRPLFSPAFNLGLSALMASAICVMFGLMGTMSQTPFAAGVWGAAAGIAGPWPTASSGGALIGRARERFLSQYAERLAA